MGSILKSKQPSNLVTQHTYNYPSVADLWVKISSKESDFSESNYVYEPVVRDGNIITSRGAGTAFEFAVELLKYFNLDEKADSLRAAMMYS